MDARGVARFALIASLLLLVQAGIPTVVAHSQDHGGEEGGEEPESESGTEADGPPSFRLTPEREFAEQLNPSMDGPRVVWQERLPGEEEDWDIMMANLSSNNISTVALTNTDYDEKRPVVHGDRVAWTVFPPDDSDNENLVVLDLATGRIHHVPDTGGKEKWPAFGGNGTLYYVINDEEGRHMRGFDPVTGKVFSPIGDQRITGQPAAHEEKIAWGKGSATSVKIHVKNTETGEISKVPGLYNIEEGPVMGPAGIAWIARYGGEFSRGSYTTLYNASTGVERFESHVYPHSNVENCETGVIWDQPGTSTTDAQAVALWDRYVEGTVTFGSNVFSGTCGADHLVYERNVQGDAASDEGTRQLYVHDLRDVRLPRDALITIDDRDRRKILRSPGSFGGTVMSTDPREPIEEVFATVDGGQLEEIETNETEEGLAWETNIDPRIFEPGRHDLQIVAVDALGRATTETFTFYTETPYNIDPSSEGPQVPREEAAPFPLNLVNHYQDYRPFYNTLLLVLLILAAIGWYAYRRVTEEPSGTPEYVPPDEPST